MTSSRVAIWIFWLGVVLAPAACKKSEPTPTGPEPASTAPPPAVAFARIESKRLPPVLEITGTLDPDEKSDVAAQFAGSVKQVLVDVGVRVKKGDTLAVLDSSEASLRLASAKAMAEQQRARLGLKGDGNFDVEDVPDVKSARETRDLAKKEAERAEKLAADGAVAPSVVDEAKTNAARAEAQYQAAKNSVDQSFAALRGAEAQAGLSGKNLKDTKIVAPFDGAVVEKRVSAGEYANVGRIIAVLVKDNPLRLKIDVPESEISGLAHDAAVSLRVSAYPGREFSGKVARIGASINPLSRTLPIEAAVPNDDGVLKPGFFVRAQVALAGEPKDVLLIGEKALGTTGSSYRVFVLSGTRVEERLVSLGRHVGDQVEIRGEIKNGDQVAVDHVDTLADSMEVAPH